MYQICINYIVKSYLFHYFLRKLYNFFVVVIFGLNYAKNAILVRKSSTKLMHGNKLNENFMW